MNNISIRVVDKFPEPQTSALRRQVFDGIQQTSTQLAAVLASEGDGKANHNRAFLPATYRLGAFDGEELVGWSVGWIERGNIFYMANSGVVASHRRRGIYSSLLAAIKEYAVANDVVAIRSQHSVVNNSVIIAKLRAGFHVTGLSHLAHMGSLVELTLHLSEGRMELFRHRTLPYVVPDA